MDVDRRTVLVAGAGALAIGGLSLPRVAGAAELGGATTETMYLTGLDGDHPVDWDFMVAAGRNSGAWSTIPTPSNWEFHGFGSYNYGFNLVPEEIGRYRHTFVAPAHWRGRRTFLVFEGSMTDTEAWLNGQSVGPKHQGGFYRFRYDVTELLGYGQVNLLEVTVSKESSDDSVNNAERRGDYWNFGGIYRPAYLESHPARFIERLAVDARADGALTVDVYLGGVGSADRVVAQLARVEGAGVGAPFTAPVDPAAGVVRLSTAAMRPRLWTAETPNLYQVRVALFAGRQELHRTSTRFGFRTVEVRPGDGIYLNGKKIILKGTNRHTIWPDSGRTTSPALSRADALLMKEMNNNAVRMSHYPPDTHFLDVCDALGLYVLDELAGWQKAYSEAAATPLVREMVTRDVNHPCVLFWDNGNEGGWNTAVDDDFARYDPQRRTVLHPWANFNGIDTDHYETYQSTANKLASGTIFMSTEFLHGLYDGGSGAGLSDYWDLMGTEPRSGGGFLWAFVDEGVVRDDQGGAIDVQGNLAPDGILGPFRQKEASFFTVKEVWAPIQLADRGYFDTTFPDGFTGTVAITNRYAFTNTRDCGFRWQLRNFPDPHQHRTGHTMAASGIIASPDIAPGGAGTLRLNLPQTWRRADALALIATDPSGQEIYTWVWTIGKAADHAARILGAAKDGRPVTATTTGPTLTMRAGDTEVTIDTATGRLAGVTQRDTAMPLVDGPALATGTATLAELTHHPDERSYIVEATYTGDLAWVQWRLEPNGWLRLTYRYHLAGEHPFYGVSFSCPETDVTGVTWLGRGPYRVWKNRMRGVTTDVWNKEHNDTATGAAEWQYPEFKGHHANTYWAVLHTAAGDTTIVAAEENLFLRLFTPRVGPDPRNTAPPFPTGDISLLDAIPPIGTKFDPAGNLGPESQPNIATGDYQRTIYLRFERA